MIPTTLGDVAAATGGRLAPGTDPAAVVRAGVEFDSRRIATGGLFLALPGERVDGHDFAAAACAAGAVGVLASRDVGLPGVLVDDVVDGLGLLAHRVLSRLPRCRVVGITGSSGKTTTKDLIAAVLGELGPTVAPAGSFNNELGHPYTVLRADTGTRFLVLENSARGAGHIAALCAIARPHIAVVLNVGSAHLGEFGSREAIAAAKGELVESLRPEGVAVLNADDPLVSAMVARTAARVVRTGVEAGDADVRAADVVLGGDGRARFTLVAAGRRVPVALTGVGAHQVPNALAAAAVALECGMTADQVGASLGRARTASRWRMEVVERGDGVTIVNDAYNANPESMRAGLGALVGMSRSPGRRAVAVLGPMSELGPTGDDEHRRLGTEVARLGIAELIVVGEQAREVVAGAVAAGMQKGVAVLVPDIEGAQLRLTDRLRRGDVVLVKASRAAGLEQLALRLGGAAQ